MEQKTRLGIVVWSTASSPPEAYAVLEHLTPDLIITDFHLNHTESSVDIIRAARARKGRFIPAIMATGDTGPSARVPGIDEVQSLSKPVDPTVLIADLRRLLEGQRPSQVESRKNPA